MDGGKEKTCMSACVDQTFDVTVSSNSFPSRESFNHRKSFCKVVRKVLHLLVYFDITSLIKLRKLSRITCSDRYSLKAVEKRYPNICTEVEYFININSCDQKNKWVVNEVSTNKSRDKLFEESILR